jgi:hypothetical protein
MLAPDESHPLPPLHGCSTLAGAKQAAGSASAVEQAALAGAAEQVTGLPSAGAEQDVLEEFEKLLPYSSSSRLQYIC